MKKNREQLHSFRFVGKDAEIRQFANASVGTLLIGSKAVRRRTARKPTAYRLS